MKDTIDYISYKPQHKIRFVTATALFDGHDASINIMRRLLQDRGAEVIHLGHNRSGLEIVQAALQEDVQAVAISSYQGGHVEFFKYIRDLLDQNGAKDVKIFAGGGGVIVPKEIAELESYGITKIYSPEDGQKLTLNGIIGHMLSLADFSYDTWGNRKDYDFGLGRALTLLERGKLDVSGLSQNKKSIPVIGITGTGGAGKSSLTDEILARFLLDMDKVRIGVLCVDPSKKKTGGALLGDRIRMNTASDPRIFIRSFATRGSGSELSDVISEAVKVLSCEDFDFLIVETSGIGQGDAGILNVSDISMYVMTSEYGASSQLEKIDMLDFADIVVINKFERRQAPDALRDVKAQIRRSRFKGVREGEEHFPLFGTIASRFEDDGVNGLYQCLCHKLNELVSEESFVPAPNRIFSKISSHRSALIPGDRVNYLSEISSAVRAYHRMIEKECNNVADFEALEKVKVMIPKNKGDMTTLIDELLEEKKGSIDKNSLAKIEEWTDLKSRYNADEFVYKVRGKDIKIDSTHESISHLSIPKVAVPKIESKSEILRYRLKENLPGYFPFAGGIFHFRRTGEDPKRQFAGEGGPARTNKRFHFLSKNDDAKRLSTAFDSVTLYGSDPHNRPDIYGKVGESGVSIATVDDMDLLFKGFDLCSPSTSVSMTINGPAPIILAMFFNTAIRQQVEIFEQQEGRKAHPEELELISGKTLNVVRGTVQADILKEDQAQNTCIFSTEFALKLMGDMQEYFIEKKVSNYYSVSISGYHIAEAGANPITQVACTLANGFTYLEYYLARGMNIDDFASNLSFFFSNGLDPEYSVIGRVARRIWSIALRDIYGAGEKAQKLKYHIQTSGRSLHAQEMDFNDIRTTLQALIALYDNCNSLHTNAYDEAVTTPTEESVRRAMAIQMIINKELGSNKCENVNQGSWYIENLTDMVEEAVLTEFDRISSRGGVLGAMETQYQRGKIQEESLYYESLKDSGELPIIGVNTFINPRSLEEGYKVEGVPLIRADYSEKDDQLQRLESFNGRDHQQKTQALNALAQSVLEHRNVFEQLMETVQFASLGEVTELLYKVGGKYRRSM